MQRLIQGLESSVALAGCNGGFDFLSWFAQTLIVPRIGLFERLGYAQDPRFAWAASAIAALGILLVVWAWFPQRWRRGQVAYQCPRCRYDLRGIVQEKAYPLRCSECALDIGSEHLLTAPRRGWRLPGVALLLFTAAYLTTIWPEVQRDGWTRLVPSTVLVLQPIDVATWPPARRRPVTFPVTPLSPLEALAGGCTSGGSGRGRSGCCSSALKARDAHEMTTGSRRRSTTWPSVSIRHPPMHRMPRRLQGTWPLLPTRPALIS